MAIKMNVDDNNAGLSMPALLFTKFSANSIPRQACDQPDFSSSTGKLPTVRNLDWPVENDTSAFKWSPSSSSKPFFVHCSWKASNVFSEFFHLAVICASARSELRSFAPSELTRTKISVTSS